MLHGTSALMRLACILAKMHALTLSACWLVCLQLDAVDPISWADLARMASEADASVHASAATAAAGSATAEPPLGAAHALTDDPHRHPHAHVPTDQAYLVQHPKQPCITTAQHTSNTTAQQAALPPKPHVKLPQPKGLSACMAKVEAVYKAGSQGLPFSPPQLEALCKLVEATDSYTEGWRSHAVSLLQALQETPQQAAYQAPAREAYTAVAAAAAANTSSADGIGSATTQNNGERSERNDAELYPLKMQQVLSHSVSGHWFGAVERVSHVLVTNSHLVAALGKLLLFGLDR